MKAAEKAKSVGLKSLTQVSEMTGVNLNRLRRWHFDEPELFNTVLLGCVVRVDLQHPAAQTYLNNHLKKALEAFTDA